MNASNHFVNEFLSKFGFRFQLKNNYKGKIGDICYSTILRTPGKEEFLV